MNKYSDLIEKCDLFSKLGQDLPISAPALSIIKELSVIISSLYYVSDKLFQKYRFVELPNAPKILKLFQTLMTRIENIKKSLALSLANDKTREQFVTRVANIKADLDILAFNVSSAGAAGAAQIVKEHPGKDIKSIQELVNDFWKTLLSLEQLIKQ